LTVGSFYPEQLMAITLLVTEVLRYFDRPIQYSSHQPSDNCHPDCGKLGVSLFRYSCKGPYFCMSLTNIIDLMNIKYTQSVLDKLEAIAEHSGYVLRYERGTFQSGYCILEQKKVVVLNKFLQIEGRINTLVDLLPQLEINADFLPDDVKRLYLEIQANLVTVEKK
jgi:hypothetical protein